jgi:hypothetical protein
LSSRPLKVFYFVGACLAIGAVMMFFVFMVLAALGGFSLDILTNSIGEGWFEVFLSGLAVVYVPFMFRDLMRRLD